MAFSSIRNPRQPTLIDLAKGTDYWSMKAADYFAKANAPGLRAKARQRYIDLMHFALLASKQAAFSAMSN
jgi:hypothetical protein